MKQASVLISAVVAATALFSPGTSAYAQVQVTFSSATGTNSPNCDTVAGACPLLGTAIGSTVDGGIAKCVGPTQTPLAGGVILKAITIDCILGGGGINVLSLVINAPGKTVIVRNLHLNCLGSCGPAAGINIIAADRVVLENVYVGGVPGGQIGIYDHRTGPGYLVISNSKIEGNGGPGIVVAPNGGNIAVVLDNVRSSNNAYGLGVGAGGRVMIKRSVFSANSVAGIQADTGAIVTINETLISHNSTGVTGLIGSTVVLSNSDIHSNNTAFSGSWATHNNNRVFANLSFGANPAAVGSATSDFGQR